MTNRLDGIRVSGLFAGIGGLDLGFGEVGAESQLLCEIDPNCQQVLEARFPGTRLHSDVQSLSKLPPTDILTAGFPCQDISLAGTRLGLSGARSGLVNEVFRIVERNKPEFFLVENVLNLLRIHQGVAMRSILSDIDRLGYKWAFRVVDSRGFDLPQRRQRVLILATRGSSNPAEILFGKNSTPAIIDKIPDIIGFDDHGFYWTEGKRGIGWSINAVPTIKGGSGLGIPSPPAIFSGKELMAGTPSIRDAERLQGFPGGWTDLGFKAGVRWKMIGNAVSAPLSRWIAEEIGSPSKTGQIENKITPFPSNSIPNAGMNITGEWAEVEASKFVETSSHVPLRDFLEDSITPLSTRALSGYLKRVEDGRRRFPTGFVENLREQLARGGNVGEFSL